MTTDSSQVGVVVIGRNEGERLRRCLRSLAGRAERIVYVDSGSADGSVEFARSMGVEAVELDMSKPFTMARGRNAGFARLLQTQPDTDYVQFVDGDCEVVAGWIESARRALDERSKVVAVAGRRRERFPEASIYNRLCDMEWDGPTGEVRSTGGDVMMRVAAFRQVGGFNERMIAGEEPELCVRLRADGGKILRLPAEMTRHDAAMTRFGQWWRRATRGGHAYAEGAALRGHTSERHKLRQVHSALFWGLLVPTALSAAVVTALVATPWVAAAVAILVCGYLQLLLRVYWHRRRHGDAARHAWLYACLCVLGKCPQGLGLVRFWWNRLRRHPSHLIEYKTLEPDGELGVHA